MDRLFAAARLPGGKRSGKRRHVREPHYDASHVDCGLFGASRRSFRCMMEMQRPLPLLFSEEGGLAKPRPGILPFACLHIITTTWCTLFEGECAMTTTSKLNSALVEPS